MQVSGLRYMNLRWVQGLGLGFSGFGMWGLGVCVVFLLGGVSSVYLDLQSCHIRA